VTGPSLWNFYSLDDPAFGGSAGIAADDAEAITVRIYFDDRGVGLAH
jgi:hypothetical protein